MFIQFKTLVNLRLVAVHANCWIMTIWMYENVDSTWQDVKICLDSWL